MTTELAIAGWICVGMSVGHTAIGVRWVLPSIDAQQLKTTPFGGRNFSLTMIRVTWYVVTIFVLGMGGLLLTLAWTDVDARTAFLRWLAGMWLAATVMVPFVTAGGPGTKRYNLRLPVPLFWVAVAVLCWVAST
jgi:hypothetical protein